MKAQLQKKIAPPSLVSNKKNIIVDNNKKENQSVDFRTILENSKKAHSDNKNIAKKDLSFAKNDQELMQMLNKGSSSFQGPKNTLGKNDFLKLFTKQLEFQNPLQPKDSSEMAAQLAQFHSLEQMTNVSQGIEDLKNIIKEGQSFSLLHYLNKQISTNKPNIEIKENQIVNDIEMSVPEDILNMEMNLLDQDGRKVFSKSINHLPKGTHKLELAPKDLELQKVKDQIYNIEIKAKNTQNQDVSVEIKTQVEITGIDFSKKQPIFHTHIGPLALEDVRVVGKI